MDAWDGAMPCGEQARSDRYRRSAAAAAAAAAARHQWSSARYRRAREQHLVALHALWRTRSKVYNRFGPVVAMVQGADGDSPGMEPAAAPARALIVDADVATRIGVRMILSLADDIEVIGEAASGLDAVAQALLHQPDVVVMAIRLPGVDGIVATGQITAALGGRTKVVIYTTFDAPGYEDRARLAGASAFVPKQADPDVLIAAIRAATTEVPRPTAAQRTPAPRRRSSATPGTALSFTPALTGREREVLQLVARGLSNAEISRQLRVSLDTVKSHLKHIYTKSGVPNRARLMIAAQANGFGVDIA